MSKSEELLALAERVLRSHRLGHEDRWSLEQDIGAATNWKRKFHAFEVPPPYTVSWDVAVGIVPADYEWTINNYDGRTTDYDGTHDHSIPWRCCMGALIECDAETGPIAICAAALKARARAMETRDGQG